MNQHPSKRSSARRAAAFGVLLSGCSVGLPELPDRADASPSPDAGVVSDGATPLTCAPGSLSGFVPPANWKEPNPLHRNMCTDAQAVAVAECLSAFDLNPTACSTVSASAPTCYGCAVTSSLAPTLGAFIDDGSFIDANVPGCVAALANDVGPAGCGARLRANQACAGFACQACDGAGFGPCSEAASAGPCVQYDISCAKPLLAQCGTTEPSYKEFVLKLVRLFCVP